MTLYLIGCFLALGIYLSELDNPEIKKHNYDAITLLVGMLFLFMLSWGVVIAYILSALKARNKQ